MSELAELIGRLESAYARLGGTWSETRSSWQDNVGAQFENDYWNEIEDLWPHFRRAVEEMQTALQAVERLST